MSAVHFVPREVQLRLDEPGDGELLTLLRTQRDAPNDDAWRRTENALKAVYRSLDVGTCGRVLDRVRALREQVRGELDQPP